MRVFWNTSYGDFFVFYDITFHRVRRISKESSYRVDFNRIDNFGLGANLFEIILPSPRVFGVVFLRRTFTWIVDRFWVKIFLVYEISVEIYLRYTSVPRNFQNGIKRRKLAKLWHLLPFQKFGRVLFNDYLPFIPKTNFQISSYSQSFSCSLILFWLPEELVKVPSFRSGWIRALWVEWSHWRKLKTWKITN